MKDCVTTMETLLTAMIHSGLGATSKASGDNGINTLEVCQVKVTDADGNLRRVYPAKGDLVFDETEAIAVELQ